MVAVCARPYRAATSRWDDGEHGVLLGPDGVAVAELSSAGDRVAFAGTLTGAGPAVDEPVRLGLAGRPVVAGRPPRSAVISRAQRIPVAVELLRIARLALVQRRGARRAHRCAVLIVDVRGRFAIGLRLGDRLGIVSRLLGRSRR